jgi:hypothetical protein
MKCQLEQNWKLDEFYFKKRILTLNLISAMLVYFQSVSMCVCVCVYIYIYLFIQRVISIVTYTFYKA